MSLITLYENDVIRIQRVGDVLILGIKLQGQWFCQSYAAVDSRDGWESLIDNIESGMVELADARNVIQREIDTRRDLERDDVDARIAYAGQVNALAHAR
jgi:hypothetical protein